MIDLGSGYSLRFTSWCPDRELNPQFSHLSDVEKLGAIITCKHGTDGAIFFDIGEEYDKLFENRPKWTVESWEPLTISPSVACKNCGCHGFIRNGRWENA